MQTQKKASTIVGVALGAGLALAAMPGISEAYTSSAIHVANANLARAGSMYHPSDRAKPTQEELNLARAEHKDLVSLIENPNTTPESLVIGMQKYSQADYYKAEAKFLIKARKEVLGDNFNGRATPEQAEEILTKMNDHRGVSEDLIVAAIIGGVVTCTMGIAVAGVATMKID